VKKMLAIACTFGLVCAMSVGLTGCPAKPAADGKTTTGAKTTTEEKTTTPAKKTT
jgi:hypothetical protein